MIPIVQSQVELFRAYLVQIAAPWLQTLEGRVLLEAMGDTLDEYAALVATSIRARFAEEAPEDGLLLLGGERNLPRAPGENIDAYRHRVIEAWDFWIKSGTVPGILKALTDAGYDAWLYEWWRSDQAIWSEFSVYVRSANPAFTAWRWDSGIGWDTGLAWDTQSPSEPARIIQIVQTMKAAHTKVQEYVFLPPDAELWDSGWVWDDGTLWTDAVHIPG